MSTERFPKTNDGWEDLSKTGHTLPKWKTMYRDTNNKAKVKKKACGAQFGGLVNKTALTARLMARVHPRRNLSPLKN